MSIVCLYGCSNAILFTIVQEPTWRILHFKMWYLTILNFKKILCLVA